MPTEVQTPVGRIVWGNPGKAQTKKIQEGPQKGQPVMKDGVPVTQWVFGIAIPKDQFGPVWAAMSAEAATGFPNGVPNKFAWKYNDGDGPDNAGQPFSLREGYAGCYILNISTEAFAPPIYKYVNGGYVQMQPNEIKTGDYISVALNLKVNVSTTPSRSSSLYVNPVAINFVGYGQEIQNTADPMALFKGQQHQLPPGASMTPQAPTNAPGMPNTAPQMHPPQHQAPQQNYAPPPMHTAPPPMHHAPPQNYAPPGPPQQNYAPPQNYQAPPPGGPSYAPAPDFVHNAGQPPAYQPPPGPPQNYAPPGPPQQNGPGNPNYGQPPGNPYPQR